MNSGAYARAANASQLQCKLQDVSMLAWLVERGFDLCRWHPRCLMQVLPGVVDLFEKSLNAVVYYLKVYWIKNDSRWITVLEQNLLCKGEQHF